MYIQLDPKSNLASSVKLVTTSLPVSTLPFTSDYNHRLRLFPAQILCSDAIVFSHVSSAAHNALPI